jgi:Protein of unknown function (DUF3489)
MSKSTQHAKPISATPKASATVKSASRTTTITKKARAGTPTSHAAGTSATSKGKSRKNKSTSGNTKATPQVRDTSKLAAVISMLRRKEGATIEQLVKATHWQAHSIRGAISGAIKKKLGLNVTSVKTDDSRVYRIPG